jgi:hypothetical protein
MLCGLGLGMDTGFFNTVTHAAAAALGENENSG